MKVNDLRNNQIKLLEDLCYGDCFIYKDMLYTNMGATEANADYNRAYNLCSCKEKLFVKTIEVLPVKVEINIIG